MAAWPPWQPGAACIPHWRGARCPSASGGGGRMLVKQAAGQSSRKAGKGESSPTAPPTAQRPASALRAAPPPAVRLGVPRGAAPSSQDESPDLAWQLVWDVEPEAFDVLKAWFHSSCLLTSGSWRSMVMPVMSSHMTTPNENMSHFSLYFSPQKTSGAMYIIVPVRVDSCSVSPSPGYTWNPPMDLLFNVMAWPTSAAWSAISSSISEKDLPKESSLISVIAERPKSASLASTFPPAVQ
eukprot:CAMPEP_0117665390 /NCGR_PEP_ID=MMETSP0804-20121206/9783_1 /TAXON_ID=1074897 /ORGANISM="Tetraselmis astigmatica, Strain CCMP880" /LENGTH=238 /DNA_ID=CAMNT_0005472797 /DNA_START=93 /DNA_END=811 /DNA_ORIENTATION=-